MKVTGILASLDQFVQVSLAGTKRCRIQEFFLYIYIT